MSFVEAEVVRDPAGRFGEKSQSAAEVTLPLSPPPVYSTPGYSDEPMTAQKALDEWLDTHEIAWEELAIEGGASPEEADAEGQALQDSFFQFTSRDAGPEHNLAALKAGADYNGIDLNKLGYPLPVVGTEGHLLSSVEEVPHSRGMLDAECECSNPDGDSDGLVRFLGHSADEIHEQFADHLADVAEG